MVKIKLPTNKELSFEAEEQLYNRLTDRRLVDRFYQPKDRAERLELTLIDKPSMHEVYNRLGKLENDIEDGKLSYTLKTRVVEDGCMTVCNNCHERIEFPHWTHCPACGAKLLR